MKTLEGDLERLGWSLGEYDTPPIDLIRTDLLPPAQAYMDQAKRLADILEIQEFGYRRIFHLYQSDNGNFLRAGGTNDEAVSKEVIGLLLLHSTGEQRSEVAEAYVTAQNVFLGAALRIFGANRHVCSEGLSDTGWRLARYRPGGSIACIEQNKRKAGHRDRLPEGTLVTSVQLTEEPSDWEIVFKDAKTGKIGRAFVKQAQGQVVTIIANERQPDGQCVTAWHNVSNNSATDRFSFLQMRFPGKEPSVPRSNPLVDRMPWGMRRFGSQYFATITAKHAETTAQIPKD
jgi:hypothetical protein